MQNNTTDNATPAERCPCCKKPASLGIDLAKRIARAVCWECDFATDETGTWRFYVGGIQRNAALAQARGE